MANIVTVSGMFGAAKTFFSGSPVVIDINGLAWPASSPFTVVRLDVLRDSDSSSSGEDAYEKVGEFIADTGGQTSISFDISSALQAIWAGYDFANEVEKASNAYTSNSPQTASRGYRAYSLCIHTEYIYLGVLTRTTCQDGNGNTIIPGGGCVLGSVTEMERRSVTNLNYADVTSLHGSNLRHGYASTKPTSSLERVGSSSITSWVDADNDGTKSVFYPAGTTVNPNAQSGTTAHAPLVLRDSFPYIDFLFVNRRGAVETCSGQMLEALDINVKTTTYSRVERPTFRPSRSLMAIASGGRRSWTMSSGYQTREWAEWWAMEFLMARQWWMRLNNMFLPVTVTPAQSDTGIYDRSKQQMPHVDFLVKLALEG